MRFIWVQAEAFGMLSQRTLRLAPGLTLLYGPNESGKSSWQAALFAGLCGVRRGGGAGKELQAFRARYRPWGGEAWSVRARVELGNGHVIDFRHDLDERIGNAHDVVDGKSYDRELMSGGAVDGSKWLGLDRDAFLAIAWVRQADILGVLNRARDVQEFMQQAVASFSQDTSVASALERLETFQREHVGGDGANAVKPLRRAMNAVQQAQLALQTARQSHGAYLQALAQVACAESEVLRTQRDQAVDGPAGDVHPAATAVAAMNALLRAEDAVRFHADQRPLSVVPPAVGDATPHHLHQWATTLREPEPAVDGAAQDKLDRARHAAVSSAGVRLPVGWLVLCCMGVLAGVALLARQQPVFGAVLLVAALGVAGWLLVRQTAQTDGTRQLAVQRAELDVERAQLPHTAWTTQQQVVRKHLQALGLPADAAQLDALAQRVQEAHLSVPALAQWEQRQAELVQQQTSAGCALLELLRQRGERPANDPHVAYDAYVTSCAQRQEELASADRNQRLAFEEATTHLASLHGGLAVLEAQLPPVAAAEESLAAAEVELARVRQLDDTLSRTVSFLREAQQQVHYGVAGALNAAVSKHLPAVTAGRYQEVRIDPQTLTVNVVESSGTQRDATLLSHGTAEQIYLLLRAALAQLLCKPGEPCPLLLDDVTVHCDAERKRAMLETLHRLSADRQIIMCSQEEAVLQWMLKHQGERDSVACLQPGGEPVSWR